MKNTISCLLFFLLVIEVNAQENATKNHTITSNNELAITTPKSVTSSSIKSTFTLEDDTCYSELSKVKFYEALIRQNNLKIELKNTNLTLKSTETIITDNKNKISYSE
ncbi:hypothetical protein [Aquimarina longa]|uniref:hypothetical protein n=1 Tax=Aquimarina longa TaxID=1080221 RepID=UPI0007839D85|nr:hypothetical protein [Aquimarina longa]